MLLAFAAIPALAQRSFSVPAGPPTNAAGTAFRDGRYGVRFQVPPGWTFTRKDREVSTFRLDARSAPPASELRGVASMDFNPFPRSVLSGALVYFSVAKHSNDRACAAEATGPPPQDVGQEGESQNVGAEKGDTGRPDTGSRDAESIGGMEFLHGHDEHGSMCVEGRDEVYTAFRKGSCYRFDLTMNTFCAVSSGAAELSREQLHTIEAQMVGILSTVTLDWEKTGAQPVPVPEISPRTRLKPSPRRPLPAAPAGRKAVVAMDLPRTGPSVLLR